MSENLESRVTVELSLPAAVFLRTTVGFMNQVKTLPPGHVEALETSTWLEEIEARIAAGLREAGHE